MSPVVDIADAAATVKLVEAAGRKAVAIKCDVSLAKTRSRRWPAKVHDSNSAAPTSSSTRAGIFPQTNLDKLTFADWRKVHLDSISTARFWSASAFMPGMKQRNWGRIVNMASSTLGSVVTGFAHYVVEQRRHRRLHPRDGDRSRAVRHHRQRHRSPA